MISLDFTTQNLYLAEVTPKHNGLSVQELTAYQLKQPLFDSENILQPQLLQDAMEAALKGRKTKEVAVTFSSLPVVANEYTFPFVKNNAQRLEMINAKVFQTLSPEEYFVDYKLTGLYQEEDTAFCSLITYVINKTLVQNAFTILQSLNKKPKTFAITQNSIFQFAKTYCPQNTLIIANLTQEQISLHLINLPGSIITRNKNLNKNNSLDVLSSLGLGDNNQNDDLFTQTYDQISKLIQYQAIKYAGLKIEKIYLMGEGATQQMLSYLAENISLPLGFLDELPFSLKPLPAPANSFYYAISAVL